MRRLNRTLNRTLCRHTTRMIAGAPRPRPPNYLSIALRAWQKVIRSRRRLMRLAPRVFDVAVVDREADEEARAATERAELQRAIAKVYGVDEATVAAQWPSEKTDPWPTNPRTLRAIEHEMSEREAWLEVAREAVDAFYREQPHFLPSLTCIARLLDISSRLGRLATGLETLAPKPPQPEPGHISFQEALERVYGPAKMTDPVFPTGAETV
jgi:hypothetical protein